MSAGKEKGGSYGLSSSSHVAPSRVASSSSCAAVAHRLSVLVAMRCANPYVSAGGTFGCGQCLPCRLNRRRIWTHRLLLESYTHDNNAFVTLTYRDECLPAGGNLDPKHTQDWLKRLRKAYGRPIRYFLVGEYGEETRRPHYHAALFGYPSCTFGRTQPNRRGQCCESCDLLLRSWGQGHVHNDQLTAASAQYVVGYVTKKMTAPDDPRLEGRHPEFARMSNRPGIGATAIETIVASLQQFDLVDTQADVPSALRHGGRLLPLGRYMQQKLRVALGKDHRAPQEVLDKIATELLPLRLAARSSESEPSLKSHLLKASAGARASLEARNRIYSRRKKL